MIDYYALAAEYKALSEQAVKDGRMSAEFLAGELYFAGFLWFLETRQAK